MGFIVEHHDPLVRGDPIPELRARIESLSLGDGRPWSPSSRRIGWRPPFGAPGAEEVDHARRVVAAYDTALAEGVGAVTVDGKMIDVLGVERARLLLDRETAIAAREAGMCETD
jgi:hypothetical protein